MWLIRFGHQYISVKILNTIGIIVFNIEANPYFQLCLYIYIYMYIYVHTHTHTHTRPDIGLAVRVFANGPGDLGSIPGRVIPKTQKMVLDASLLNTQHYKVRIKGKVEQSREGVAPSPTPWCSSYRKGNLRVTLDYGRQLYFTIYIYIYWERDANVCSTFRPSTLPPFSWGIPFILVGTELYIYIYILSSLYL